MNASLPGVVSISKLPTARWEDVRVIVNNFRRFLEAHPRYRKTYERLLHKAGVERLGRVLASCAHLVYRTHGDQLGPTAEEILAFVENHYPAEYVERYLARIRYLSSLQRRFDRNPCRETLGDPAAHVHRDDYSLSLLLSIVFTNHRFEIMTQLSTFMDGLAEWRSRGRIAAIGIGTGYELTHAARALPDWDIEAYETDHAMRLRARQLWNFFRVSGIDTKRDEFPLDRFDENFVGRYDAVVMCELCEHLHDPLGALTRVKDYLKDDGRAFVTMAVNIAQEDHVFLYPSIESCRAQLRDSGLHPVSEWIAPQAFLAVPQRREEDFQKGNYIAITSKRPAGSTAIAAAGAS